MPRNPAHLTNAQLLAEIERLRRIRDDSGRRFSHHVQFTNPAAHEARARDLRDLREDNANLDAARREARARGIYQD